MNSFSPDMKAFFADKKYSKILIPLLLFLFLIVTLQDFLHSLRNHYNFYLSESLLFNSYWLWFIPVPLTINRLYTRITTRPESYQAIILFVAGACILHILSYAVSVYLISSFFYEGSYSISKMLGYTISEDFYKYIFVYTLTGFIYRSPKKEKITDKADPVITDLPLTNIIVGNGRNKVLVAINEILYIKAASPYIALHTTHKTYLHTQSLKSIITQLPAEQFVQVHKSAIVNLQKVISYKSRLNGDYDLLLQNKEEVRLSRNYASGFRSLFR